MRIDLRDLSDRYVDYVLREGHRGVEGWIEPGALTMTTLLDRLQQAAGVRGGFAEIGVHHGRFFIALALLLRAVQGAVGTRRLWGFEVIDQPFPWIDLCLGEASHARAFGRPLLRAMRFTAGIHPAYRFGAGWSHPESWGTWTDGPEARLTLSLDPPLRRALTIEALAQGYVHAAHPRQDVEVRVRGSRAAKWIFKDDDAPRVVRLAIGPVLSRRQELVIDFRMADCRSPRDLGLSDDARRLGLGLRALKILDGP